MFVEIFYKIIAVISEDAKHMYVNWPPTPSVTHSNIVTCHLTCWAADIQQMSICDDFQYHWRKNFKFTKSKRILDGCMKYIKNLNICFYKPKRQPANIFFKNLSGFVGLISLKKKEGLQLFSLFISPLNSGGIQSS